MRVKLLLLTGLAAAALSMPLPAGADIQTARGQLASGNYAAAVDSSLQAGAPDGYLIAAEAISAQVMLNLVPDVNASAKLAKDYAQKALDAQPENPEALIQYALALGFETRSSGIMRAWFGKLPEKSKAAIDAAHAAAPDDPRTSALMGAWHLGIVRKAGEARAGKMYGASLAEGMRYYDDANARAPSDIVIAGNYAISLLGIDAQAHKARATALLTMIQDTPPKNAVERDVQARMAGLLDVIDDGAGLDAAITAMMHDPEE